MKCEYCGSTGQSGECCEKCGAPLPKHEDLLKKSEPFFYNGFICYVLRDYPCDTIEVQFWLGRDLIERIKIPQDLLRERFAEGVDYMTFFWDLFLVAQGEKEVLEIKERNDKHPAVFEIRRIPNPERERWLSMSYQDLVQEYSR